MKKKGRSPLPKIQIVDVYQDKLFGKPRWDERNVDEHLWWPRVIAIDPGVVSGLAVIWFDPVALMEGKKISRVILAVSETYLSGPEDGINGQAHRYLQYWRHLSSTPGTAAVAEDFVPRQMNMSREFLAPVRIAEKISFALSMENPTPWIEGSTVGSGEKLHRQSPSDALSTFNNARLQTIGLHTPGPDHINDAKRHALLWIRKIGAAGRDTFEQAHGQEEGWWEQ